MRVDTVGMRSWHLSKWLGVPSATLVNVQNSHGKHRFSSKVEQYSTKLDIQSQGGHPAPRARKETVDTCKLVIANDNHVNVANEKSTVGQHLARRLVEIGIKDVFGVPGDSNLTLLDYMIAEPGLNLVGCCNELNAGYAADGYARCKGVGACVVTLSVGGLSLLNAIAGAYAEDLPLICIVGGPNTNDYYAPNTILHHTIALPDDFSQEFRCFQPVTCHQAVIKDLEDAHEKIDVAIATALTESKPVYISIACNLAAAPRPFFLPVPFCLTPKLSNERCLEMAVEVAAEMLNKATKPVIVGGPRLRMAKARGAFMKMANDSGYPIAVLPSAKGMVPEHHSNFIGTYWGVASSSYCAEIVETADAYLFAGPLFNGVISLGNSLPLKMSNAIIVHPNRVVIANGPAFGGIFMKDFFVELTKKLKRSTTAFDNYQRIHVPNGSPLQRDPKEALRVSVLFTHIQKMLSSDTTVFAESGDAWFHCQKLQLPQGCGYECQMQYASIGWSIGATLGYAQAAPQKLVIACVGDGSFQMTAQEVSTMLRCGQNSIIFLINNGGYTTEVEIHDGPYNVIKNWDYTALVETIDNGEGKCWTAKVQCEEELIEAIEAAMERKKKRLCFIEVIVHRDDTSKELLQFGCRLAASNGRPPKGSMGH